MMRIYSAVAAILAIQLLALTVACNALLKGLDKSSQTTNDTRNDTAIKDSPGSWSWNWTMPDPTSGAAAVAGLAMLGWVRSGWNAHRHRQALDRAVCGIERCGSDCSAKEHLKHYRDPVEKVIHSRVVKLTKGS